MAKKAAKKTASAKTEKASKSTKKEKAKPLSAKSSKETKAKDSKPTAKPAKSEDGEKSARAPKLTLIADSESDSESSGSDIEENIKPAKAAKPKAVKISAAQRKADKLSSEASAQWADLHQKYSSEKAQVYDMKAQFEANKPLQHKVLGWGWIMSVENDRLEVMFQDGKRMLISNYKPR